MRALPSTEGARYPFWSPDGAYLGFFARGRLKKIAPGGGPPQTICDAVNIRGAAWNRDGVILFSPGPTSTLFRVSAGGGAPVAATRLAATGPGEGHRFPEFLPDGRHFFYHVFSDKPDTAGLYIGSLDGMSPVRIVAENTNAVYAPPVTPGKVGYILFRREETLMAQPFDSSRLKTTGEMLPVAEHVMQGANIGFGSFSASSNGILVYRSSGPLGNRELVWLDRAGKRAGEATKPVAMQNESPPALSPDNKTIAISIGTPSSQADLWLQDVGRNVLTRFTFGSGTAAGPIWSPDGGRIVYQMLPLGGVSANVYLRSVSGVAPEELLLQDRADAVPMDWSPDGKWLLFEQRNAKNELDLWLLPMEGERKPIPYLLSAFSEANGRFSPDGKWVAYASNESGKYEVYVRAFSGGVKYQVSTQGGNSPAWRHDGKELYYLSSDQKLEAVPVKFGSGLVFGPAQALFDATGLADYAPTRDGQRFLVNVPAGGIAPPTITAVINWQAAFK
jgi:hypothetical protein